MRADAADCMKPAILIPVEGDVLIGQNLARVLWQFIVY